MLKSVETIAVNETYDIMPRRVTRKQAENRLLRVTEVRNIAISMLR